MAHLLEYQVDDYNCVQVIDPRLLELPCDTKWFDRVLNKSLQHWKNTQRKAVWLQLKSPTHLHLVPYIGQYDFYPHHAQANYIMFVKWMDPNQPNQLPNAAQHVLGVGAVVINSKNQILMVQEASGPSSKFNLWKLPGGLVDSHENISEAAIRELKEETGVNAKFKSWCCAVEILQKYRPRNLQNQMNSFYVKNPSRGSQTADVYCMCLCEIEGNENDIELVKQSSEIADIRWIDIDDVFKMPLWRSNKDGTSSGAWGQGLKTCIDVHRGTKNGFTHYSTSFAFNKGQASIYHSRL